MLFNPFLWAKPVGYSVTPTTHLWLQVLEEPRTRSPATHQQALQLPPSKLDHLTLIKRVQDWHRLRESGLHKQAEGIFDNLSESWAAGIRGGGWGTAESTPRESFTAAAGADHGLGGGGPGTAPKRIPHLLWYFARVFLPPLRLLPPRGSFYLSPGGDGEAFRAQPGAGDRREVEGQTRVRAASTAAPAGP